MLLLGATAAPDAVSEGGPMPEHLATEDVDAGLTRRDERTISRADVLKTAALAGGTLVVGGAAVAGLPKLRAAAPSPRADVEILNFFLLLERLQSAFYQEALGQRAISGEMAEYAELVAEHERQHVEFLEGILGADADPEPTFDLGDSASSNEKFGATAAKIEDTTVSAYIGQGANLSTERVLDAARIVSVEARHLAWMRDILGEEPAPNVADKALAQDEVMSTLRDEGFVR
jgi:hypothetical protein